MEDPGYEVDQATTVVHAIRGEKAPALGRRQVTLAEVAGNDGTCAGREGLWLCGCGGKLFDRRGSGNDINRSTSFVKGGADAAARRIVPDPAAAGEWIVVVVGSAAHGTTARQQHQ